jgi:hypothetical protein
MTLKARATSQATKGHLMVDLILALFLPQSTHGCIIIFFIDHVLEQDS